MIANDSMHCAVKYLSVSIVVGILLSPIPQLVHSCLMFLALLEQGGSLELQGAYLLV